MTTGIMNLSKWTEKTVQAVRHICSKKQAPCVGFSLVFFDPMASEEERWNYVIELAYDPHNPPSKEEQERIQGAFEYINEGVRRLMDPEKDDNLHEYTVMEPDKSKH